MANELPIPDTTEGDPNALEVLRVWVAKGGQHVSIHAGAWNDPEAWGIVLADWPVMSPMLIPRNSDWIKRRR